MLMDGQRALLASRRAAREGRKEQLAEQAKQFHNQIAALEEQKTAAAESISLIEEQVDTAQKLRSRDLLVNSELNQVRRERAGLLGNQSAIAAEIADAAQQSAQAEMSITLVDEEFDESVLTDLAKTRTEIARLRQERVAAQDKLSRLEIRAPFAGFLHELEIHTVGGVITGGERLVWLHRRCNGRAPRGDQEDGASWPHTHGLRAGSAQPPRDIDGYCPRQDAKYRADRP